MRKSSGKLPGLFLTSTLALSLASGNSLAGSTPLPPPASMQLLLLLALADNAMALTHRLLNESSAAKSVMASDNAEAKALHAEALKIYEQAVQANDAGDEAARDSALKKAKMTLFRAAILAKKKSAPGDHSHTVYKTRAESAAALLDAHQRIRKEKNAGADVVAVEEKARADMAAAEAAFKQDDVKTATQLIDQALSSLKGSLISLRDGSTLVRSLNFETPKEEYEYELDRNQSHTLLTNMLLQNKKLSEFSQKRFDKEMQQARALRKQAEEQAAADDYEMAIKTLEESTKHIVRAIRAAGVYIPG